MAKPTYWVKMAAAGYAGTGGPWDLNTAAPTYTDITSYVRSMSWQRGRGSSIDEIGPGSGTLKLRNSSRDWDPSDTGGPFYPLRAYRPIQIGCNYSGTDYTLFHGFVESWDVAWESEWGTSYSETTATLVDAIALLNSARFPQTFGAQALSSARIGTVLSHNSVRFPTSMRDITAAGTLCKGTTVATPPPDPNQTVWELKSAAFSGGFGNYPSAWEVMQGHVLTHPGDLPLYIDRRGYACYKAATASGLTFGDSGSEIPYTASGFSIGVDQVLNAIEVTAEGGVVQAVSDTTSVGRYRWRSYSRTTLSVSDAAALGVANDLLTRYKDPKARLEGFKVRPGISSTIWSAVITLDLEHTITANRRPPGGGTMFSQTPKIVGLSWEVPQVGISQDTTINYTLTGAVV